MHWVFRGVVHYLDLQCDRLGVNRVIGHRARNNREMGQIATLLSQLTDRHKVAYRPDGINPVFYPPDQALLRGIFNGAEERLQQLHVLAASADMMMDDAYKNFPPLTQPERLFEVNCTRDAKPAVVAPPPDPMIAAFVALVAALDPAQIDGVLAKLDEHTACLVLAAACNTEAV